MSHLGWLFNAVATVVLVALLALALSRYGKIPLGKDGERPEFSTFSWIAMLFAADPAHAEFVRGLRGEFAAQCDHDALEEGILASQARRRLVAAALLRDTARSWDFAPDAEQRYVRGDFWSALTFG